jgi:hypothetical protein
MGDKSPEEAAAEFGVRVIDRVEVNWSAEPTPIYSNFCVVGNRGPLGEFTLNLCSLSDEPPAPREDGKVVVNANVIATVKMPAPAFLNLINAMIGNWNRWAQRVGPGTPQFSASVIAEPGEVGSEDVSSETTKGKN